MIRTRAYCSVIVASIVKAVIAQSKSAAIWFQRWITKPKSRGCSGVNKSRFVLLGHFCLSNWTWYARLVVQWAHVQWTYTIYLCPCAFIAKEGSLLCPFIKMGSRRKPPRLDMLDFSRQPGNKPLKTFQDASNDKSTSRLVELGVLTNVFLCPELWLTSHIILSSAPLKYHRCFLWVDIDEASGERKSRTSMSSETVWLEG